MSGNIWGCPDGCVCGWGGEGPCPGIGKVQDGLIPRPPSVSPVPSHRSGWACPSCGRCYAPWVLECSPCNKDKFTIDLRTITPEAGEPGGDGG